MVCGVQCAFSDSHLPIIHIKDTVNSNVMVECTGTDNLFPFCLTFIYNL
jgi:hypothetical protein